jgi:23S rRNA pseudouridine2605 synthase
MSNDQASGPQRLHKVLARAGVASRRGSEQLIAEGRVSVDGRRVAEQGVLVDPRVAVVEVDGKRIAVDDRHATYALNKPKGVLTAMSDTRERCVGDLLREASAAVDGLAGLPAGLFHVGRLDAHRLVHPSYEIPKTYIATVRGVVAKRAVEQLRAGVTLEDGPAKADEVCLRGAQRDRTVVEVTLHEGRNRIVRRMFDEVGHPVVELARLRIGPIRLGDLQSGALRALSSAEVGALWAAVDQKAVRS